ncbi:hypothetical protein CHS0354_038082, partial [Potamilus streckersoni]
EDCEDINQFRKKSLMSDWKDTLLYPDKLNNQLHDQSITKSMIHIFNIGQLVREAMIQDGNWTNVWLDYADSLGSISYKLIELALDHYHIPAAYAANQKVLPTTSSYDSMQRS